MKIIDLKQNLENLYRSENIILCGLTNNRLRYRYADNLYNESTNFSFLSHCCKNNIRVVSIITPTDHILIRKVLKECYNIVPDKEGRYS